MIRTSYEGFLVSFEWSASSSPSGVALVVPAQALCVSTRSSRVFGMANPGAQPVKVNRKLCTTPSSMAIMSSFPPSIALSLLPVSLKYLEACVEPSS